MAVWICLICGWRYDSEKGHPESGITPGTALDKLPEDWVCPECGAAKDSFEKGE
ncbi:MAG: rubredoxin [Candidatus Omnitrophica bacterium]|nr:rubredoxin [Candidatus Omnitrophota bacterium]